MPSIVNRTVERDCREDAQRWSLGAGFSRHPCVCNEGRRPRVYGCISSKVYSRWRRRETFLQYYRRSMSFDDRQIFNTFQLSFSIIFWGLFTECYELLSEERVSVGTFFSWTFVLGARERWDVFSWFWRESTSNQYDQKARQILDQTLAKYEYTNWFIKTLYM